MKTRTGQRKVLFGTNYPMIDFGHALAGLDELMARAGVPWAHLAQAVHGTTLGSNVVIRLLERRLRRGMPALA